jgi:hypothetical protein
MIELQSSSSYARLYGVTADCETLGKYNNAVPALYNFRGSLALPRPLIALSG